jgi:TetR/AcrR family transcriptional regulator
MIWATTQHYADFDVQIRALLGHGIERPDKFGSAKATLERVFLNGVRTQPPSGSA